MDVKVDEGRFGHGESRITPARDGALRPNIVQAWNVTTEVTRRRLLPLAFVVTALLVVVAIVAHGRPLGSGGGTRGGLPPTFWDYVFTTLVILEILFVLLWVVLLAYVRKQRKQRPGYKGTIRALVVLFTVMTALVILGQRLHLHRLPPPHAAGSSSPQSKNQNERTRRQVRSHAHIRWDEFAIVLGVLVALGAFAVAARRRLGAPAERVRLPRRALAAALDESLDDLRSDPDLRRAIIAAYARMETALAAAGLARRPSEAPLEYLERALLSLDTSSSAIRRLTDLFEWARFSQHEPEPSMRDEAVDALVAVRDELRASELVAA